MSWLLYVVLNIGVHTSFQVMFVSGWMPRIGILGSYEIILYVIVLMISCSHHQVAFHEMWVLALSAAKKTSSSQTAKGLFKLELQGWKEPLQDT